MCTEISIIDKICFNWVQHTFLIYRYKEIKSWTSLSDKTRVNLLIIDTWPSNLKTNMLVIRKLSLKSPNMFFFLNFGWILTSETLVCSPIFEREYHLQKQRLKSKSFNFQIKHILNIRDKIVKQKNKSNLKL